MCWGEHENARTERQDRQCVFLHSTRRGRETQAQRVIHAESRPAVATITLAEGQIAPQPGASPQEFLSS